jgi:hypothetical protein
MTPYRYVADDRVMEYFDCLTKRERGRLLGILDRLAESPHIPGDLQIKDRTGRVNEVKDFGLWRVTYWTDSPVHEVRIVDIERLHRRTSARKRD